MKRILIGAVFFCMAHLAYGQDANEYVTNASKLEITNSTMSFGVEGGRNIVTILGTIHNNSGNSFKNINVEVSYFDAKGQLIDSTEDALDSVIGPNGETSFRTRNVPDKPVTAYSNFKSRVAGATMFEAKAKRSELVDFFYSFGPVLLLIIVWIVFMKKRFQGPAAKLCERQLELMTRQAEAVEKLVVLLDDMNKNRRG